jgi:hypothetical protein
MNTLEVAHPIVLDNLFDAPYTFCGLHNGDEIVGMRRNYRDNTREAMGDIKNLLHLTYLFTPSLICLEENTGQRCVVPPSV